MNNHDSHLPVIVITGASGFIGRHFLESLCEDYFIYALARRSQQSADIPFNKNISWIRVDIGNEKEIKRVINNIALKTNIDYFLHFAGYFDFDNRKNTEYTRTNINGTRYVLEAAAGLNLKRFVFSSSLAIMDIDDPTRIIDESSVPDAKYPYALSKIAGEKLIEKFSSKFPCTIIRFAAIFSDWCEHLPLYALLSTWFSKGWDSRILAGKGESAIPYLHINDLISFFNAIVNKSSELPRYHILNASPDYCTSHRELFRIANAYNYFRTVKPLFMPKWFITMALIADKSVGYITKKKRFERLWMVKYIDKKLQVYSSHTCQVLQWSPRKRYSISRRLLCMIAKMKSHPYEWHYRNRMRPSRAIVERKYIKIYEEMLNMKDRMIEKTRRQLLSPKNSKKFATYQKLPYQKLNHRIEYIFNMLEIDVCTGDRSHILEYARNLAEERYLEDFSLIEVIDALKLSANVIIQTLFAREILKDMKQRIYDEIMITLQMVMDEVEETYERLNNTPTDSKVIAN